MSAAQAIQVYGYIVLVGAAIALFFALLLTLKERNK